jgi:cell wall assembly regulator SMI1
MNFRQTSKPVDNSDLESVEHELGIIFPPEFREHYLAYNGGCPGNDIYIWPNGGRTSINIFASIKAEGFINLEKTYRDMVLLESYLPVGIVPFATDDGGNLFCISARQQDFGTVYYHNNDHYNITNKEEALTILDRSFKHFIDNLSK